VAMTAVMTAISSFMNELRERRTMSETIASQQAIERAREVYRNHSREVVMPLNPLEPQEAHAELSAARRLGAWCADPSMRTKPGWSPGAGVDLGYELPNGDPAQMSVSEFVGALLAQELKDGSGLP
jgi:hypothetical protein